MSFPRYSSYKPSGVEWLGDVPEHWTISGLSHRYEVALGKMLDEKRITGRHLAPYVKNSDVQWDEINVTDLREMDFDGPDRVRYSLRRGDLLVCEGGEVGRCAVWHAPIDECYYQKALHRLRPHVATRDTALFLRFVLRAAADRGAFASDESKATIAHLPAEALRRYRFPFPPTTEQWGIASFLDRETAKIDALVAEQERLIELLKEKRQAAISHAVTKGLNPDVPMKPSGVEWLGGVPAHWQITKVKFAAAMTADCPHETPVYSPDGQYLVIRTADVAPGVLSDEGMYRVDAAEFERRIRRAALEPFDVVYTREGERWGLAALVAASGRYCLGQRMFQLRAGAGYCPAFLMWHLNANCVYAQAEVDTVGATAPHVNLSTIRNFALVDPPVAEQRAIAAFLSTHTSTTDHLVAQAQSAISLLRDRRAALVSAAVTGQIDVRDFVPVAS